MKRVLLLQSSITYQSDLVWEAKNKKAVKPFFVIRFSWPSQIYMDSHSLISQLLTNYHTTSETQKTMWDQLQPMDNPNAKMQAC